MNMPGFTAEVSLYKTSRYYHTMENGNTHASRVVPQVLPALRNIGGILEGALECLAFCFCCASSLNSYCCINCAICTEILIGGPVIVA